MRQCNAVTWYYTEIAAMWPKEQPLTMIAVSCFLNVVIRGVEVWCDVLGVHIGHCHLQLLEALGYLQIFWVVVNADDPAPAT